MMTEEDDGMKVDAGRAKILASNLQSIFDRASKVAKGRSVSCQKAILPLFSASQY